MLTRCTQDLASAGISCGFAAAFLARLSHYAPCCAKESPRPTRASSMESVYGGGANSDESAGLLSLSGDLQDSKEVLISSLAADRSPAAVKQLRDLADVDIFEFHESAAARRLGYVLALTIFLLRCWDAWLVLLEVAGSASAWSAPASVLELLAWVTCLAVAHVETACRRPRSALVLMFWASSVFAPGSTLIRALAVTALSDDASAADSVAAEATAGAAELRHAVASVVAGLALICTGLATVSQHQQSSVWQIYQGAWSLQREGTGEGALDRLMGVGDSKESGGHHRRGGGSWCPERGSKGSASVISRIRRLIRLGRPDARYICLGISGFVLHASSKVWYQLLWGRLIDAVYAGDRPGATATSWQILLASMMAVWFDQYASVFLSIGGARLSARLQHQVFSLIMEQDATFFDRIKTGSLMTILSTNVGSIQNVLVHQTADLAEGIAVTVILLFYMLVRDWRLTLVLIASTVLPMGVNAIIAWVAEQKTERLMELQAAQGTVAVSSR